MKAHFKFFVVAACLAWLPSADTARAEDVTLRFIHALQKGGYEDIAVDYLKTLQQQPNMPAEVRDVFDLEMSNSLRGAANRAYAPKEKEQMLADSQKYLTKFLKEKPDHPAAVSAMVSSGDVALDRALKSMQSAKALVEDKDKEQKAKLLAEARTALTEADKQYKDATEKFRRRLAAIPPTPKEVTGRKRQAADEKKKAAELDWLEARFKSAMIQYQTCQTIEDPKDPERNRLLLEAAKAFDAIYQPYRGTIPGLYAHMWEGKCRDEAGDVQTADDIYQEVLAFESDQGGAGPREQADPALAPVFAQVNHFRMLNLAKQKPAEFLPEADQWLKTHKTLRATDGFQGISLAVAKAKLALAEEPKAAASDKTRLKQEVMLILRDMARTPSSYQHEAILLRRGLAEGSGTGTEPTTFDEAVALGNDAVDAKRWDDAIGQYKKALELGKKAKTKEDMLTKVQEAIARCSLMIAKGQFGERKFAECLDTVRDMIKQLGTEPPAVLQGASLAVYAALQIYAATPDSPKEKKEENLQQLMNIANFVIKTWPQRPEADDARMCQGQSFLVVNKIDKAIEVFEGVNQKSERYPQSLFYAGRTYWSRYQSEKAKPEGQRNQAQLDSDRAKAQERLVTSLETQRKAIESAKAAAAKPGPGDQKPDSGEKKDDAEKKNLDERAAATLMETQVLLADIYLEANQHKESLGAIQSLIDNLKAEKPKGGMELKLLVRIFVDSFKSNLALGDLEKAGESGSLLAEIGPDNPLVNGWLMEFARQLNDEYKKADAAKISATNDSERATANTKLQAVRAPLGAVLSKLAARQISPKGQVFVADTLSAVGLADEAGTLYEKILEKLENDEEFSKALGPAETRVRTQLIQLMWKKGDFEKALTEVNKLVEKNPNALEPKLEKGRILQAWAEKDPQHYPDAIKQWALVRKLLQGMKKRPPEFYEVSYNIANCFLYQAKTEKDKTEATKKAKQGEEVLKSMVILNPALNGPDMVARYNDLLNKLAVIQGRKPTQPAPAPKSGPAAEKKPATPASAAKPSGAAEKKPAATAEKKPTAAVPAAKPTGVAEKKPAAAAEKKP